MYQVFFSVERDWVFGFAVVTDFDCGFAVFREEIVCAVLQFPVASNVALFCRKRLFFFNIILFFVVFKSGRPQQEKKKKMKTTGRKTHSLTF